MGYGSYSVSGRSVRAVVSGIASATHYSEVFESQTISNEMNPKDILLRESCDSDEHPCSMPVILALDVTGSMGHIPFYLVKEGLPHIMGKLIELGLPDIQLLFVAVGDHECDSCPLQVGQFETNDELLDHWLTTVYIESGGGGNIGESYHLAWWFAGNHTRIDSFEKRKQKGVLITIGDELVLPKLDKVRLKRIVGQKDSVKDYSAAELLDCARKMYEVYHIHASNNDRQAQKSITGAWRELLGDHLVKQPSQEKIADEVIKIVLNHFKPGVSASSTAATPETKVDDFKITL